MTDWEDLTQEEKLDQLREDIDDLEAALSDVEAYAMVSYTDQPEALYSDWKTVTRAFGHDAGSRQGGHTKEVTERLICNFDPADVRAFTPTEQATLVADGEGCNVRYRGAETNRGGDRS